MLTCSRSGLPLPAEEAATLTAVTLVMNESMGSTASLVTAMMKASQVARSSFSSSFLLSTYAEGQEDQGWAELERCRQEGRCGALQEHILQTAASACRAACYVSRHGSLPVQSALVTHQRPDQHTAHLTLHDAWPTPADELHHCIVGTQGEQRGLACRGTISASQAGAATVPLRAAKKMLMLIGIQTNGFFL